MTVPVFQLPVHPPRSVNVVLTDRFAIFFHSLILEKASVVLDGLVNGGSKSDGFQVNKIDSAILLFRICTSRFFFPRKDVWHERRTILSRGRYVCSENCVSYAVNLNWAMIWTFNGIEKEN